MVLRHGRPHNQDRVRVGQVLLSGGGAAAPEGGAQTGHRGAMSYPGLVADAHHSQAGREEFLDEIVFFVVERGAAQMRDGGGMHHDFAVFFLLRTFARENPTRGRRPCPWRFPGPDPPTPWSRDADSALSVNRCACVSSSKLAAPLGQRCPREIGEAGSPSIEMSLPFAMKYKLPAAYPAVRADRTRNLRCVILRVERARAWGHGFLAGAVAATDNLPH